MACAEIARAAIEPHHDRSVRTHGTEVDVRHEDVVDVGRDQLVIDRRLVVADAEDCLTLPLRLTHRYFVVARQVRSKIVAPRAAAHCEQWRSHLHRQWRSCRTVLGAAHDEQRRRSQHHPLRHHGILRVTLGAHGPTGVRSRPSRTGEGVLARVQHQSKLRRESSRQAFLGRLGLETEIADLRAEIRPTPCAARASHPVRRVQHRDVSLALRDVRSRCEMSTPVPGSRLMTRGLPSRCWTRRRG